MFFYKDHLIKATTMFFAVIALKHSDKMAALVSWDRLVYKCLLYKINITLKTKFLSLLSPLSSLLSPLSSLLSPLSSLLSPLSSLLLAFKGHSKIVTFLISGNFNGSIYVSALSCVPCTICTIFLHLGSWVLTRGAKEEDIQKQILKKKWLFNHKS